MKKISLGAKLRNLGIYYLSLRFLWGFLFVTLVLSIFSSYSPPSDALYLLFFAPLIFVPIIIFLKCSTNPVIKGMPIVIRRFYSLSPYICSKVLVFFDIEKGKVLVGNPGPIAKGKEDAIKSLKKLISIHNLTIKSQILCLMAFLCFAFVSDFGGLRRGGTILAQYFPFIGTKPLIYQEVESLFPEREFLISPPSYTRQDPNRMLGYRGDLKVLPGSQLRLKVKVSGDFDEVFAKLNGKKLPFKLKGDGYYSIKSKISGSAALELFVQRSNLVFTEKPVFIGLSKDEFPSIKLTDFVETEFVGDGEALRFRVEAQDDFGLTKLDLVVEVAGQPRLLVPLKAFSKEPQDIDLNFREEIDFAEASSLLFYVEVNDNDRVSGPKKVRSRSISKEIRSKLKDHKQNMKNLEKFRDDLVDILAKSLNFQIKIGSLHFEVSNWLRKLRVFLESLSQDYYVEDGIFQGLSNLKSMVSKTLASYSRKKNVTDLENSTLYLDDLIRRQSLEDARALVERLRSLESSIKRLLDQWKNNPSEEIKTKVLRKIAALEHKMKRLMAKLAKLQTQMPTDYFNREALKENSVLKSMKSLSEMVKRGQMDAAFEKLSEMSMKLKAMEQMLNKQSDMVGQKEYMETMEKIDRFVKTLDEVEKGQAKVEKNLKKINKKVAEKKLKEFKEEKKDKKLLSLLEGALQDLVKIDLQTFPRAFELELEKAKRQVFDALDASKKQMYKDALQRTLKTYADIRNLDIMSHRWLKKLQTAHLKNSNLKVAKAIKILKNLLKESGDQLMSGEKQKMKRMAQDQRSSGGKVESLKKLMQAINKEVPIFDEKGEEIVNKMGEKVKRLERSLDGLKPGEAHSQNREILNKIQSLRDALQNPQQKKQGKGKGKKGMPLPRSFGFGQRPKMGNPFKQNNNRVKIPGREDYRIPKEFREDIIKAMRKKIPENVKKEVLDYYKELVK